jgi:hypothetical protein
LMSNSSAGVNLKCAIWKSVNLIGNLASWGSGI